MKAMPLDFLVNVQFKNDTLYNLSTLTLNDKYALATLFNAVLNNTPSNTVASVNKGTNHGSTVAYGLKLVEKRVN